jgi:hypothetical protein
MEAKLSDAEKQFEALRKSASNLTKLRGQIEQAQKQHTNLVKDFLDAVENDDQARWNFKLVEKGKIVSEGALNKQAKELLRPILAQPLITGGAGIECAERAGCVNTGQLGYTCFYLCKTVHRP